MPIIFVKPAPGTSGGGSGHSVPSPVLRILRIQSDYRDARAFDLPVQAAPPSKPSASPDPTSGEINGHD
ncbi:hypothetical protein ACYOEI_05220 [Singulisphaera rosea]